MRELLRRAALAALAALVPLGAASPAGATLGGGYGGTSGNGIWALSWWIGNPDGQGPYTGPPASGVDLCSWHDVGPAVSDLGHALSQASLPPSFWTVPRSGRHPGIWGVLEWASHLAARAHRGDHFDLVACPQPGELPPNGGYVESALPLAHPPGGAPLYLFCFFDTVVDPPAGELPPVVKEAFDETHLPAPEIATSPSSIDDVARATVVNLPTWLWIQPTIWHRYQAEAAAGGLVATVWAYPETVTWTASWDFPDPASNPEGGVSLAPERVDQQCRGPGAPYRPGASPEAAGACAVTFAEPTFGTRQPLRAGVTWSVHWALSNGAGVVGGEGRYGEVVTAASLALRVMQVEAVITAG